MQFVGNESAIAYRKQRRLLGLLCNMWEKAAILGPFCNQKSCLSDVIMGCNARKDYYGIMPSLWLIHSQVTIVIEVQFDERWVLSSWKYGDYDTAEIPTKESWCAFDVSHQVIRQIFWNIGSVFGTFFKIIYLLNYKASCKMLLQGYYMFYGQYFCWLHTYQTSRYVRNYVL